MRYSGIHQLLPSARADDIALREAVAVQRDILSRGIRSEIFVAEPSALDPIVRAYTERSVWARPGDALVATGGGPAEWDGPTLAEVPPDLPPPERLRVALVANEERSGIQTYAAALARGMRAAGHEVRGVGVRRRGGLKLVRDLWRVRDVDLVVVEHEFGHFATWPLFLGELALKRRGIPIALSPHEIDPDKFGEYVAAYRTLHYRQKGGPLFELGRIAYAVLRVAWLVLKYRLALWALGLLPDRIVVHSRKAYDSVGLITSRPATVDLVPHLIAPLEGLPEASRWATPDARRALRRELGLPEDGLLLVSPGFLFRRKRLVEIAAAAPRDATLVIAGTGVWWESDHPAEIREFIAQRGLANVVLDESYERMPLHLAAADAVVLYYRDIFQSGIASHAIHAGKPLILSRLPSFRMYESAALYAGDEDELALRMREIASEPVRERLAAGARALSALLTPEAMALRYLAGWTRR